jgi:putative endopeptidase
LNRDGVSAVFRFGSEVNRMGDLHYVAILEQARLPLSSNDYRGADSSALRRRNAYSAHVARTFVLAGESAAAAEHDASKVVAMEAALAAVSMTRVQQAAATLEDTYRPFTLAQVTALSPGFAWAAYLRERRAAGVRTVIVSRPAYVTAVAKLVVERPVEEWRAFLRWQLLADASPYLSSAFANEAFRYLQETSGIVTQPPRWERCARETGDDLPELLGRVYAGRVFNAASKARIDSMVTQLRAVLIARLETVPWLTATTRAVALEKAKTFGVKIGYPDQWHDYSSLRLTRGAGLFVAQRNEARRFENDRLMGRIGQAPITAEWDFHGIYHFVPQSPTAWANWGEIIFPAAYLQAPLYDPAADIASNFGGIGVVIGHEMTHLFTADGGDIDARGKIRHWWTAADSTRFAVVQQRIVRQYDAYTVVDSATHVNGALTLDENLADIGGVELAYAALERALANSGPRAARDTTPEMRFFLAYARSRVSKSRPQFLRQQVLSDGHAPSEPRVNGPLSDFAPFAQAFHCKPGDPMMRPSAVRVQIW